jgi:hypothetical protein
LRYAGGMTEQQPAGATEREIEFRGRTMWAKLPSDEQILVYSRTLKQLDSPEAQSWNGEQALKALDRTLRIVQAVLVNRLDREWLEDEMLEERITLPDACQIIQLTAEAFGRDEKKPAPRKRAARRKVTT